MLLATKWLLLFIDWTHTVRVMPSIQN